MERRKGRRRRRGNRERWRGGIEGDEEGEIERDGEEE